MAGKRREVIPGRRVLYNIGAMGVTSHIINCTSCHKATSWPELRVGQMVDCVCGKRYDCVWYRPVSDGKELQDYFDSAKTAPYTSYDYETNGDDDTGNDPFTHYLVGCSFCRGDQRGVAIYIPLRHDIGRNMPEQQFIEIAAPFMRDNSMAVHSAAFMEWPWTFVKLNVAPRIVIDTQIVAYLEDPNRTWRHDRGGPGGMKRKLKLKALAKEIWDIDVTEISELVDLSTGNFGMVPVAQAYPYGCQDSDLTTMLEHWGRQQKVQENQPNTWKMEHDIIPVSAKMTLRGIKLNPDHLVKGAGELDIEIEEMEREVFREMGFEVKPDANGNWVRPFDLGSTKSVGEHLFFKMGLPYDQKKVGKSGVPSTAEDALQDYLNDWPVVKALLDWRGAVHMRDNFVATLPNRVNPVTGFIHGSFNQTGAPTGRFSHSNPNLAQIPKIRD